LDLGNRFFAARRNNLEHKIIRAAVSEAAMVL
jgi:hypothetical protein